MKKNIPTILLALSITTLYGFTVATALQNQEIELTEFLNGRSSANFRKTMRTNIKSVLAKGTTAKVNKVVEFCPRKNKKKQKQEQLCNAGLKVEIMSGPKKGQNYWVYFDAKDPNIKLLDKVTKEEVKVEEVRPEEKETDAVMTKDTEAIRDPEEQAVLDTAKIVVEVDAKKINEVIALKGGDGCSQDGKQEEVKLSAEVQEIIAEIKPIPEPVKEEEIKREIALEQEEDTPPTPLVPVPVPPTPPTPTEPQAPELRANPYSPQEALADLNSENLKLVGKDFMPGDEKIQSCIFQNSKVYVIYEYCTKNRKEAEATSITIISKTGGETSFFLQNSDAVKKPASKAKRSEYDLSWTVTSKSTTPPKSNNVSGIKDYVNASADSNFCLIGKSLNITDGAKPKCNEEVTGDKDKWMKEAESFWKNPPESRYSTLGKLRGLVEKTR